MFRSFNPDNPLSTFAYANNALVSSRSEGTGVSGASYGWDDINRLTSQMDTFSGATGQARDAIVADLNSGT